MRDDIEIRELRRDDLDTLLEAYSDLLPGDDPLPPRAQVEALWDEVLANPKLPYLGAFEGRQLLATCTAVFVPNLTRGMRPYAVIENVWTHPGHRRQGLGASVMKTMLERCWAQGCYKVMLLSGMHRGAAHEFYEQIGFDKNAKQGFIVRKDDR